MCLSEPLQAMGQWLQAKPGCRQLSIARECSLECSLLPSACSRAVACAARLTLLLCCSAWHVVNSQAAAYQ